MTEKNTKDKKVAKRPYTKRVAGSSCAKVKPKRIAKEKPKCILCSAKEKLEALTSSELRDKKIKSYIYRRFNVLSTMCLSSFSKKDWEELKEFGIDKDVFFDPKALSRNKKTIVN